jgi:hypothetical protein
MEEFITPLKMALTMPIFFNKIHSQYQVQF